MADRESAVERTDDLPVVSADLSGPGVAPGGSGGSGGEGSRATDRDPTALAAWRRVAEQRRRRLLAESPEGRSSAWEAAELPPAESPPADLPTRRDALADAPDRAVSSPDQPARRDVAGADGAAELDRHEMLLGLAGRVDDDALSAVRELVAVEDTSAAAELLGGCLLAGRVGVTPAERGALDGWFVGARVDPELVSALPSDPDGSRRSGHRFAATLPVGSCAPTVRADGETLAGVAQRLPGVRRVRQCWRLTPAGSSPGPVPHRVVLVETESVDDRENVTHHVAHAARALGTVSVEVFATGADLPAYHRDALAVAVPLTSDPPVDGLSPALPVEPVTPSADSDAWHTVADSATRDAAPETADAGSFDAPAVGVGAYGGLDPRVVATSHDGPGSVEESASTEPDEPALADLDREAAAERIAALWAQPSAVDVFSAPLSGPLEPTGLEPPSPDGGSVPSPPLDGIGALPRGEDALGAPTPDDGDDDADLGRVRRARHSRGGDGDDVDPGAGLPPDHDVPHDRPGLPWSGLGGIGGVDDGHDPLLASPIDIGPDPLGSLPSSNGHRIDDDRNGHRGPDTDSWGRWSDDVRPAPEPPARPWSDPTPTDPTLRRPEQPPPSSPSNGIPPGPAPKTPSEWNAHVSDTGDGVASQLSERERELLARLHEELAARERLDPHAADPLTRQREPDPLTRREPEPRTEDQPRPSSDRPPQRRNGYVNGHVNGHDLPRRHGPSPGSE